MEGRTGAEQSQSRGPLSHQGSNQLRWILSVKLIPLVPGLGGW